jgi:hypothetical protein
VNTSQAPLCTSSKEKSFTTLAPVKAQPMMMFGGKISKKNTSTKVKNFLKTFKKLLKNPFFNGTVCFLHFHLL